jgi:hypothetical protein
MKTYDLVKYTYGQVKKYTAFCLTPALKAPRLVTLPNGKQMERVNEGASSLSARHFESRSTAEAWLVSLGQDSTKFDWSPLPGTATRHAEQRTDPGTTATTATTGFSGSTLETANA